MVEATRPGRNQRAAQSGKKPVQQVRVQGSQGEAGVKEAYKSHGSRHARHNADLSAVRGDKQASAHQIPNKKTEGSPSPEQQSLKVPGGRDPPKISTTKLFEQSSMALTTGRASHMSAGKQESDWKRQLIEHDIRLQNAKLQMVELQHENKLAEMRELLYDLQDKNQQIELEKQQLAKYKDKQIKELSQQVKQLEQQLIDANLEIANVRTKLSLEQQLVVKIKQSMERQDELFGTGQAAQLEFEQNNQNHNIDQLLAEAENGRKKRGSTFLKMFRFDKARTPKHADETNQSSIADQSVDYANYLLEIQEGKQHILNGLKQKTNVKQSLIRGDVQRETIDFYDLRESGAQQETQRIQEQVEQTQTIDHQVKTLKEVNQSEAAQKKLAKTYQVTSGLKEEIYEMIFSKTADQTHLRKWVEGWLPQIRANADLTSSRSFKEALKKGVPIEVRGEAWEHFIGNDLRVNQQLYDALLVRVRLAEDNIQNDIAFKKNIKVVEEDLHRTFVDLGHFRYGQKLYQPLKNILAAFSVFRPDVGYVQGMSYIAGSLLMHTGEEFLGFKCFANMMNRYLMYNFYSFDMPKVNIFFHCYMRLLKERVPRLHQLMTELQIQCSVFLFEWVIALFANIFSLDVSSRLWDSYLYLGDAFLMKICVSISAILEKQLNEENFEMLIIMFKSVDQYVTEENLFAMIDSLKLTDKQYEQVRRQVEATPNLERLI